MNQKTPVALFVFNRLDLAGRVLEEICRYDPPRIYICSDGGRTEDEKTAVAGLRDKISKTIPEHIEVVELNAPENIGVLGNLGMNMIKILTEEPKCIFIEDDNLPSPDFFRYCDFMLEAYEAHPSVLWICGTNYLDKFPASYDYDIAFTKHHFPCGFATWSHKFLADYQINPYGDKQSWVEFKNSFGSWRLWAQDMLANRKTEYLFEHFPKYCSWDRQMQFVVRSRGRLGIIPRYNLIENIGVDERSTHGGTSTSVKMTQKFCSTKRNSLPNEIKLPPRIALDAEMEKTWETFFLMPKRDRMRIFGGLILKILTFSDWYRPNFLKGK